MTRATRLPSAACLMPGREAAQDRDQRQNTEAPREQPDWHCFLLDDDAQDARG